MKNQIEQNWHDIAVKNSKILQERFYWSLDQLNTNQSRLIVTLFTVNGIILAFAGGMTNNINVNIPELRWPIAFLIFSWVFGFIAIWVDISFWRRTKNQYEVLARSWMRAELNRKTFREASEFEKGIEMCFDKTSSSIPVFLQAACLFVGVVWHYIVIFF